MTDDLIQAEQQLKALRTAFYKKLPGRINELHSAAGLLSDAPPKQQSSALSSLRTLSHKLAGSAGTFSFSEVGTAARTLELLCDEASAADNISVKQRGQLLEALTKVEQAATSAEVSTAPQILSSTLSTSLPQPSKTKDNYILLVEDDLALGEQLSSILPNFGFKVKWCQHPNMLAKALDDGTPSVLLMDIVYPDGRDLGVTTVQSLQTQGKLTCPVLYISVCDDFDVRLKAAKTGCDGYLPKPLDIPDLIETLKYFVQRAKQKPFRVLTVEDDEDLLAWYKLILSEAGFEVETEANPTKAVTRLREFKPDVILMDIEMPGCSGLELASVIRQHVEYLQIPIVFITGIANDDNRLDAWRSGGDDFILKPVDPVVLIPSLRARAEKSRALISLSLHEKVKASRERFHVLASVSPVATLYTDPQGLCMFINPQFTQTTGTSADGSFGQHWTSWVAPLDKAKILPAWSKAIKTKEPFEAELRLINQGNKEPIWVIARASPQIDESGIIGYAISLTDISNLKRKSHALEKSQHLLETTFASIQDVVLIVDTNNWKIIHSNAAMASVFGYSNKEIHGLLFGALFPNKVDFQNYQSRLSAGIAKHTIFAADVSMCSKEGHHILAEHTVSLLEDFDDGLTVAVVIRDVTETRILSGKLAYQATHDSLTGLYNRFELEHRLEFFLERARTEQVEGVLCYLDLDRFKLINDTCGHAVGDQVLREIADLLSPYIRQSDTLVRLGGDEFAVLMEQCGIQQAQRMADTVLQVIQQYRFNRDGKTLQVGVSIGMVTIDKNSGAITDVLKAADMACYGAKEDGRHCVHIYHKENKQLIKRMDIAQWGIKVENALDGGKFQLFSQPISTLNGNDSGQHFELLLRMVDTDGKIIEPDNFLPAAEQFYLGTRVDRWVVNAAFSYFTQKAERLQELKLCAINLSGQSLNDKRFLEYVLACFSSTRMPPEKVCFEITETAAVSDISKAQHFIKQLKEVGCYFALDDFGTGNANFSYLKKLPVDFLKIDGSFVKDILDDPLDLAMINAINQIGHVLGKKTIAEYVENELILDRLQEIGVDYAQGYHIGHPHPLIINHAIIS
jgi:diguanylate cyclase (GGDEF)-like protein/PAS domain S-box-containing protein